MADPNSSPVASNSGALATGSGSLQSDLGSIEAQYEPQIEQSEGVESQDESKAVGFANQGADQAAAAATDATADDAKMKQWVDSTPTRQAAYATAMHTAPVLALLVAIGGAKTKLTGGEMLAATTGIVQGMNAGAEKQYTDSYNAWMASYQKMKEQHQALMQAHSLMLESYQGRADAYQKAAEAARRQTGELLDQKQQKLSLTVDTFKAQSEAMARLDRTKVALEQLHERQLKDAQQATHWKQIDARSNAADPRTKALIAAAKQKYANAKALMDEAMKYRGQVNSNLTMSDEAKEEMNARIDMQLQEESAAMQAATEEGTQLAQGIPAAATPKPGAPAPPPLHPASPPAAPSQGAQLSAGKLAALKKNMGQPVTFADQTVAIMKQDGSVQIIGGPIDRTVH